MVLVVGIASVVSIILSSLYSSSSLMYYGSGVQYYCVYVVSTSFYAVVLLATVC